MLREGSRIAPLCIPQQACSYVIWFAHVGKLYRGEISGRKAGARTLQNAGLRDQARVRPDTFGGLFFFSWSTLEAWVSQCDGICSGKMKYRTKLYLPGTW